MSRNIYRDVGCSQEDHLPNCGHFGESGAYLSPHAKYCKSDKFEPCTCNPKAREKRDSVPSAPTPSSTSVEPQVEPSRDESAWLIERRGLCLGFECNKPKWITFTNENALRFARKCDGENFVRLLKEIFPIFRLDGDCVVTEHMWVAADSVSHPPLEQEAAPSVPTLECKCGVIHGLTATHEWWCPISQVAEMATLEEEKEIWALLKEWLADSIHRIHPWQTRMVKFAAFVRQRRKG